MPRTQGTIYHIMIRGNEKKNIFLDDEDRLKFLDVLKTKKSENGFELYAYCLMNNHVHLLINQKNELIARVMKCINVSYAIYFNRKYNRVGHLFQDRFRSEVIDQEAYLISAAKYIHNNPVKAGLVQSPDNFDWSSCKTYFSVGRRDILTDTDFLLDLYSLNREAAIKAIKKHTAELTEEEFIDLCEVEARQFVTKSEAVKQLNRLLEDKGVSLAEVREKSGVVRGTFKHELIVWLKSKSNLSCREIGELLGVSKSTVQELN